MLLGAKIKVSTLCPAFVSTKLGVSERNKPKELDAKTEPNLELKQMIQGMQDGVKKGMSPEKVSDITFQAIKNDLFYILPHTHLSWKKMCTNRMDGIVQAFNENKLLQKKGNS